MADTVVSHLSRLVGTPTVSRDPVTALAADLAQRAEDVGFAVEKFWVGPDKCSVIARAGPLGTEGLVLSGHMDVVPVDGQDWSQDPFVLTQRGDRLLGRGACDMKGFIAACLTALSPDRVARLRRELVLIWTHDEEIGCVGSAQLAQALQARDAPFPRRAVIGEPTSFRMCRLHPGHTTARVICRGKAAHSSRPDLGASAIAVAQRVLAAIEALHQRWRLERRFEGMLPSPWTVLNVGRISGGVAINIVPEHCTMDVGIRQLPGQSGEAVIAALSAVVAQVDADVRSWGGQARVETLQSTPALLTAETAPVLDLVRPHACHPAAIGAPFATDAGNLAQLGIESVVFGPGSIDVAHRPDEYIPRGELERCVDVVGQLVDQACAPD